MKSLHLAILTQEIFPEAGGVQTYLYEVARRLAARMRVTVLTTDGGTLPADTPFERVHLPKGTIPRFSDSLRAVRPDLVLVGHAHPRLLVAAALAGRYGAIAFGNDFLAAQHRWHRSIFNALLRRAAPLITISAASRARLDLIGIQNASVIFPGTDPSVFTPAMAVVEEPVLLTVGRLVSRKGHDAVLRVLPELKRQHPDLKYRIAGEGPERSGLEALATDLGVRDLVEFLGPVSAADLPSVYRSASIFLMPVRDEGASLEGFGIVFLEASASGLPVIAGRSGGAAEALLDGETGILVPPDDPDAILKGVRRLLLDADLRRRMGQAGRRWVENEMNWDRAAAEFVRALR